MDGRPWVQKPFPYQAECLRWLREAYDALPADGRERVDRVLSDTGCEVLFSGGGRETA